MKMESNGFLLLLASTAFHFMKSDLLLELRRSIPIICKPYHPVFVFYEPNRIAEEPLLDRFLPEYNQPLTIVTQTDTYFDSIPSESCALLFLGNFTDVEKIRKSKYYKTEHPRLIVTHISFFHSLLVQFDRNTLINCVYFVHNESRYAIFHYDDVHSTLNRWTTISSNPIVDVVGDMNGRSVFVHPNLPLEPIEMHMLRLFIARQNGTIATGPPFRSWIVFNSLEHIYSGRMRRNIYTIRTTHYRAVVPRIGERQPMLAVLLDPFDAATWMIYGAMIISVAVLRMWFSQLCTWKHLMKSIQDVFACVLLSSPRIFYRPMEQAAVGLFMLLNVVLFSAYESLVISFLLNPRFYPEIDTVRQLDGDCCWYISDSVAVAARGPCWFNDNHVKSNESLPMRYRNRYTCFMLQPRLRRFWNETLLIPMVARHYRWSKAVDNSQFVFGVAYFDIGVAEIIQNYADAFFAEGALYKYHERVEESDSEPDINEKAVHLDDLLLLWMSYFSGLAICALVFPGEVVVHLMKKWRICYAK